MLTSAGRRRQQRAARPIAGSILALLVSPAAGAECKIFQTAEFAVKTTHNRSAIDGEINGQKIKVLIDTGAAVSVIWRPSAKRLGLPLVDASQLRLVGIGGESYVQSTTVKDLAIGAFAVHNLRFAVAGDLKSDFDLVLGEDFFGKVTVEFDLAHGAVRLFQPKGCKPEQLAYWSTTYSVADLIFSPADRPRIETTVLLNGKEIRAVVDSGAMVSVVSSAAAERAGVTVDGDPAATARDFSGMGRKSVASWSGLFESFTLGDETIRNARLRVMNLNANYHEETLGSKITAQSDILPKMLIGADFLLSHRVVVDGADRKMIFTYTGGPVFQTLHSEEAESDTPSPNASDEPASPPEEKRL